MKKIHFLFSMLLISSCSWIQEKRNEKIFDLKEYKQEEASAYSQLLEQITNPARDFKDKNRKFLFFLRTDTLEGLEIEKGDEDFIFGKLRERKLNLDDINKYSNLKVLYVPKEQSIEEEEALYSIYWEYRKKYWTTGEVIDLSRIAFNQTYTRGVLNYWYNCGSLCGEGCTLYIKKVDGKWVVDSKVGCIVS